MTDKEKEIELESCTVKCPRCDKLWQTSLLVEHCNCLVCGTKLDPKKHVTVKGEKEIN